MTELHRFKSVWDAISDSPEEAANMRARGDLLIAIIETVKKQGLSQVEVAARSGLTQPRVSDLMRGRITRFSLDALFNIATALGHRVVVGLEPVKARRPRKSVELAE
jgi:predicted XRE-type DNA-binding protein